MTGSRNCLKCSTVISRDFPLIGSVEASFCELHYPLSLIDTDSGKETWSNERHNLIAKKLTETVINQSELRFDEISVGADVSFRDCTLAGLDIRRSEFLGVVEFINCKIIGDLKIADTTLRSLVISNCTFSSDFYFVKNKVQKILMTNVAFQRDARFSETVFEDDAVFHGIVFERYASFRECKFERHAIFDGTSFVGYVHFLKAHFERTASFSQAQFKSVATFDSVKFNATLNLAGSIFSVAPTFFGASISGALNLFRTSFRDFRSDFAFEAYRDLRSMLGKRNAGIDESNLYFIEQKVLTRSRQGEGGVLFPWLYELCSGYGTSWRRPIGLLVFAYVAASVYYLSLVDVKILFAERAWTAIEFALRQVFAPFAIWARPDQSITPLASFGAKVVGAMLSAVTLISLVLLTLSLRWRFKKDN